jgi:hypothetical protein
MHAVATAQRNCGSRAEKVAYLDVEFALQEVRYRQRAADDEAKDRQPDPREGQRASGHQLRMPATMQIDGGIRRCDKGTGNETPDA